MDMKKARQRLSNYRTKYRDEVRFHITDKDLRRLLSSKCWACGSGEDIVLDHIIPLFRGGVTSVGNLQPLCRSCNLRKGSRLQIQFRHNRRVSSTVWLRERDRRAGRKPWTA